MSTLPDSLPFPEHFRFGTSVSSFQVEGNSGIRKSDWDLFLEQNPTIVRPGEIGPEWWKEGKAEGDIDRMSELGMQTQRLSFEWARIEPVEGEINHQALRRYREIIDYLHKKKIQPLVTLNHYTLPQWISEKGSWENPHIVDAFEKYVTRIATEFGDVRTWITLNEPGVLIEAGYLSSYFPPQKSNFFSAFTARRKMIQAHNRAYAVLKKILPKSYVSMAFAFRWYRPEDPKDFFETKYANMVDYFDSLNYIDAVKNTIDFIGCNFYAGYFLNLNLLQLGFHRYRPGTTPPKTILFGEVRKSGAYVSDLGAPIVPGFFLDLLQTLTKRYHKPIIITENGIADKRDIHRAFYLLTHLVAVWRAIQQGIDIKQYLVWSTVDNLEWSEGYREEFGLVHVDATSGERTVRKSAHLYRDIVKANEIHITKLISQYLEGEQKEKAEMLIHHVLTKHHSELLNNPK
ncbi:MAG TPA: family 1 glycosylhydrolase [Candidatus Saccharimonadales bacterium]|nr:family 1 glycosylhydrolase [Candidatus Saccharimonadales bacterium]